MLGDSFRTGMTIERSGVIERESKGQGPLYYVQVIDRSRVPGFNRLGVRLWDPGPLPTMLGRLALLLGLVAVGWYASLGLTLAHYDAKAHLVVARRILDSLTPGWEQIGAVWLPLPHLINMGPIQIDALYRTGGVAIAISVLANAVATASIAATVLALTSSRAGAILASALFVTNPNILYLQSTPMTEPLSFGLSTLQVWLFTQWVLSGRFTVPVSAGWVTVLACLTRYEAWPVTIGCFVTSAFAWWRRGRALREVLIVHARLAVYPLITVMAFTAFSRITVGEWFVSGGFFVPDDSLRGQPAVVIEKINEGIGLLGGGWLVLLTQVALGLATLVGLASAGRSPMLVSLSLFSAAGLPLVAYYAGHPFRLRYEIPLLVAAALTIGIVVGLLRRWAAIAAIAIFGLVVWERPPFDPRASMVSEARLDRNQQGRAYVTGCLKNRRTSGVIMMSMGALGHYMHELSAAGFEIRDFLHEGNGPLWDSAFTRGPAHLVEWVIVEEVAEGGDAVIDRHRQFPAMLEDYARVCSGGGIALYRRRSSAP